MAGEILLRGQWHELVPDSLPALRAAAQDPWEQQIVDVLQRWWDTSYTMEMHTSGSTGTPQKMHHRKVAIVESARRTIAYFNLVPGSMVGLVLPVQYVGGMMMLLRGVVGQWRVVAAEPKSSPVLGNRSYDFVAMTPSQAVAVEKERHDEWNAVRHVLLGGGTWSRDWLSNLSGGPTVHESFGMTETVSHFALRQIHPDFTPLFHCLKGCYVAADANGALKVTMPDGVEIATRDAVRIEHHQAFEWLGRIDDAVNSGGVKIHPAAVEAQLDQIISGPFRCYGVPDARWGEALVLRIHAPAPPVDAEEQSRRIVEWAENHLPKYHAPKRVEWAPLKQTPTGKWKTPKSHE